MSSPTKQMHLYESISLSAAGIFLGILLIAIHLWMFLKQDDAIAFLKKFPRNYSVGIIFMAVGMLWFWLLVTPDFIRSPLAMDLNDFNKLKIILLFVIPIGAYLIINEVKEFLSIRGLGLIKLMLAAPLLAAAFQEPGKFKFLVPLYAYILIVTGLFWVSMPYMLRDLINWATATQSRFKILVFSGLGYGVAVLLCAIVFW